MPFQKPFDDASAGDFVYGLYDENATITQLEKRGCVRMGTEVVALHAVYDLVYDGTTAGNHGVKRNSKLGLHLFSHKNRIIHFVLDNIKITDIINKTSVHRSTGKVETEDNRGITGSELRWIYRNRDNPTVQGAIQFWHEGRQCTPPWEASCPVYSPDWGRYKPTRPGKSLVDLSLADVDLRAPLRAPVVAVANNNNGPCCGCVIF